MNKKRRAAVLQPPFKFSLQQTHQQPPKRWWRRSRHYGKASCAAAQTTPSLSPPFFSLSWFHCPQMENLHSGTPSLSLYICTDILHWLGLIGSNLLATRICQLNHCCYSCFELMIAFKQLGIINSLIPLPDPQTDSVCVCVWQRERERERDLHQRVEVELVMNYC